MRAHQSEYCATSIWDTQACNAAFSAHQEPEKVTSGRDTLQHSTWFMIRTWQGSGSLGVRRGSARQPPLRMRRAGGARLCRVRGPPAARLPGSRRRLVNPPARLLLRRLPQQRLAVRALHSPRAGRALGRAIVPVHVAQQHPVAAALRLDRRRRRRAAGRRRGRGGVAAPGRGRRGGVPCRRRQRRRVPRRARLRRRAPRGLGRRGIPGCLLCTIAKVSVHCEESSTTRSEGAALSASPPQCNIPTMTGNEHDRVTGMQELRVRERRTTAHAGRGRAWWCPSRASATRGVTGAEATPPAAAGGGVPGEASSAAAAALALRAGGAASMLARREVQGWPVSERPGDSTARCGDGGCQAASLGPPPPPGRGPRLGYSCSKAAWRRPRKNCYH